MKQYYNRIALVGIEQEEYDIIKANYSGHNIWHQSITRFKEVRQTYLSTVIDWINKL